MSRTWRKQCPRSVRLNQQNALSATFLYLIRQAGPSAYVIKDDHTKQQVTVRLGDCHSCTCREYELLKDICLHIAWVLLKKLKLKCSDPLSFQIGLVPRELQDCLHPKGRAQSPMKNFKKSSNVSGGGKAPVGRRQIQRGDSCPICLEEYWVKHTPVVYCRYSCGNPVHVKCMVIVAQHQVREVNEDEYLNGNKEFIQCPLCRGDFMTIEELTSAASLPSQKPLSCKRVEKPQPLTIHPGTKCRLCLASPVQGNLYRCLICPQVYFCAHCLLKGTFTDLHNGHSFMVKKAPGEKWKEVRMDVENEALLHSKKAPTKSPPKTNRGLRRKITDGDEVLTNEEVEVRTKAKMALESGSLYKVPTFEQMVEASILLQENLLFSKSKNLTSNIRKVLKRQADVKLPPPEVRVHRAELYERGQEVKPPVVVAAGTGGLARRKCGMAFKNKRVKGLEGGGQEEPTAAASARRRPRPPLLGRQGLTQTGDQKQANKKGLAGGVKQRGQMIRGKKENEAPKLQPVLAERPPEQEMPSPSSSPPCLSPTERGGHESSEDSPTPLLPSPTPSCSTVPSPPPLTPSPRSPPLFPITPPSPHLLSPSSSPRPSSPRPISPSSDRFPLPTTSSAQDELCRIFNSSRRSIKNDDNKVSLHLDGRSLGAQVQPLMAVLMHPRYSEERCNGNKNAESEDEGIEDNLGGVIRSASEDEEEGDSGSGSRSTLEMKVAQFEAPQEAEVKRGLKARSWTQLSAKRWSGPRSTASF